MLIPDSYLMSASDSEKGINKNENFIFNKEKFTKTKRNKKWERLKVKKKKK